MTPEHLLQTRPLHDNFRRQFWPLSFHMRHRQEEEEEEEEEEEDFVS